jgi:altronate hydrolase
MKPALLIDPSDNLGVALRALTPGETVDLNGTAFPISEAIPPKQKFTLAAMAPGDRARMYGVTVGVVTAAIPGGRSRDDREPETRCRRFQRHPHPRAPVVATRSVDRWQGRTFDGYHRSDGKVGTANHWLVIPMVFCETRNVNAIRTAFERALGYERTTHYQRLADRLVAAYQSGADARDPPRTAPGESREVAPRPAFPQCRRDPVSQSYPRLRRAPATTPNRSAVCSPATSPTRMSPERRS